MARGVVVGMLVAVALLACWRACGRDEGVRGVDVAYVRERMASAVVVDVRTPSEYAQGHIDGALNIDSATATAASFAQVGIGTDDEVILYCRTGRRARAVARLLTEAGYTDVVVFDAGYPGWSS